MPYIKNNIAQNITELRLLNDMTQLQLGEKLNYSDKTVSKWERGESTPDIEVLVELADLFGVTVDSLVRSDSITDKTDINQKHQKTYNRRAITLIVEAAIMLAALFAFIITSLIIRKSAFQILYFVYAVPIILIISLIFNSVWFNPRRNYYIISALIWSILAAIYITFLYFSIDVSLIFLLGIAGQIIIIICSFLSKPFKRQKKLKKSKDV
ncbi:MAG: helix-turn-helix domain-containing protein [Clostridia bacterium]|nr:helix-turn-helix domain-containing protein [Clostridia bacterium]